MLRVYLNNERLSLGSTGISVKSSQWDKEKERIKGRTTEALNTNLQLDNIASGLQSIFRRIEMSDVVSLERIKSEFLDNKQEFLIPNWGSYAFLDSRKIRLNTFASSS